MLDLVKKSIYLGLGAVTVTREKVENLVDELIEKGQLKREQKATTVQDIMKKVEKEEQAVINRIKTAVEKAIKELGLPTKQDIEDLKKKLEKIEKLLESKS